MVRGEVDPRPEEWSVMGKVGACHSSNRFDPDVYHDYDDCPTGQQIPPANKVGGTGGSRRCKQCTDTD